MHKNLRFVHCFPHIENVDEGVQDHGDDVGFFNNQHVTQWLQSASLHHADSLLSASPSCNVCDCPHCFLSCPILTLAGEKTHSFVYVYSGTSFNFLTTAGYLLELYNV